MCPTRAVIFELIFDRESSLKLELLRTAVFSAGRRHGAWRIRLRAESLRSHFLGFGRRLACLPPVAQIFYNQAKKGRATAAEVLVLATLLALYPLDLAQSELVERGNET